MKRKQPATLPASGGKRVAVVSARFYEQLADQLEDGARRALADCGVNPGDVTHVAVPGCFELPIAIQRLVRTGDFDAFVALGVVIRGDTPHFEYVAGECARGLMSVQLASGIPIGFGVLTTDSLAQAEERADPKRGDKGYDAAIAALTVAAISAEKPPHSIGLRH